MSGLCPTCGQALPPREADGDAQALLDALAIPLRVPRPKRWHGEWIREAYQAGDGFYYLTYPDDIEGRRLRFSPVIVDDLATGGRLISGGPGIYYLAPRKEKGG